MVLKGTSDNKGGEMHHVLGSFFTVQGDHQPLVTSTPMIEYLSPVAHTEHAVG